MSLPPHPPTDGFYPQDDGARPGGDRATAAGLGGHPVLDAPAAVQLGHLRALVESRPRTEPDDAVSGADSGAERVQGALAADRYHGSPPMSDHEE